MRADGAWSALLESCSEKVDLMQSKEQISRILNSEQLMHRLAEVEHERWAHWQRYLHDQCAQGEDGALIIPAELVKRWSAQINTPYSGLSEAERESDQEQVRRYLPIIIDSIME